MIDPKRVKERVFKALKSQGYQVKMYDNEGMSTVDPELATRFYVDDPNLLIHVDEDEEEVTFNKNGNIPLSDIEDAMWAIKAVAKEYMYKTTIRDYGKRITPKDFSYQTKIGDSSMDNVQESAMYGSKKTSRQMIENVCLVVKHKEEVDEDVRGSRSRNIQNIFLECGGERYKFPHKNLNGARAMARHLANGGAVYDSIGESIVSMTGKMIELKEFYSYAKRNRLISEDTTDAIEAVKESISAIAGDLKAIFGKRTYATAAQRIAEQESFIAENDDGVDYKDLFTVKKFDEQYESVLPVISSIVQERNMKLRRIEESSLSEVKATPINFVDGKAITFESEMVKMGHRLRAVSRAISENAELASYIGSIGDKMISESDISDFEKTVVKNVLENMSVVSKSEPQDLISESTCMFESKLMEMEDTAYDNMLCEGPRDLLSKMAQQFKSFFRSASDDLMDLGLRLKDIQGHMQTVAAESAPEGWEGTVKAMKSHPEIDNPWALAHWMKNKGYKSHETESIEEALREYSGEVKRNTMDPVDARKEHYVDAIKKFNAAKHGLGIANKLNSKEDKAKHQKRIMGNINSLRADVEWLEDAFGIGKKHRYQH